jgi:hypothetical protein
MERLAAPFRNHGSLVSGAVPCYRVGAVLAGGGGANVARAAQSPDRVV